MTGTTGGEPVNCEYCEHCGHEVPTDFPCPRCYGPFSPSFAIRCPCNKREESDEIDDDEDHCTLCGGVGWIRTESNSADLQGE